MIDVTLVSNSGDGRTRSLSARDGVLLEDFLEVNFDGDVSDFSISVRRDGDNMRVGTDFELSESLEDGDRVSLAPKKVEGAVTL